MAEIVALDGVITGSLSNTLNVTGTIARSDALVVGTVSNAGVIYKDRPIYDGSYEVTPLVETEQILETEGKRMEDDVVVLAIPYYETTNDSGGYTVIIG